MLNWSSSHLQGYSLKRSDSAITALESDPGSRGLLWSLWLRILKERKGGKKKKKQYVYVKSILNLQVLPGEHREWGCVGTFGSERGDGDARAPRRWFLPPRACRASAKPGEICYLKASRKAEGVTLCAPVERGWWAGSVPWGRGLRLCSWICFGADTSAKSPAVPGGGMAGGGRKD